MARKKLWSTQSNQLRLERRSHTITSFLSKMKKFDACALLRIVENISIKTTRTTFFSIARQATKKIFQGVRVFIKHCVYSRLSTIFWVRCYKNIFLYKSLIQNGEFYMFIISNVFKWNKATRREKYLIWKWRLNKLLYMKKFWKLF